MTLTLIYDDRHQYIHDIVIVTMTLSLIIVHAQQTVTATLYRHYAVRRIDTHPGRPPPIYEAPRAWGRLLPNQSLLLAV